MQNASTPDRLIPTKRLKLNKVTGSWEDAPNKPLFLKGPISMEWLSLAAKLPGKAFHLAVAIQWLAGMSPAQKLKITAKALELLGVSKDAYRDGLRRLEEAGLVSVERRVGQFPWVSINPKDSKKIL
jgi:DNA-binding transcriptional ArsR family regulator